MIDNIGLFFGFFWEKNENRLAAIAGLIQSGKEPVTYRVI